MPDWTYHPLRSVAVAVVGAGRAHRAALRALGALASHPAGFAVARSMSGGADRSAAATARLGASVPVAVARDAIRALPALGAGIVEVGPVGPDDVEELRRATAGRRCTVLARVTSPEVADRVAPYVDRVVTESETLDDPDVARAAEALARQETVLASPSLLVAAGPGWFQRVNEAAAPLTPNTAPATPGWDPRRWPAWWWGYLVGIGMVTGGVVAAAITLGPLLLWYDQDYLGGDRAYLNSVNHHLVHFLQHDRITLAGTMVSIGVLYAGLALGGLRRGWVWARNVYLASGAVGFPTLFYFLGSGFLEPLHVIATVVLFPMFLLAVRRRPRPRSEPVRTDGPEAERRRALAGQLIMVAVGVGLVIGGVTISVVGLTGVFVHTDLLFLDADAASLHTVNDRLVPFIAHDRAGFGGALASLGVAVTLLSVWGWRRGEAWVWWTLTGAAVCGFVPTVIVHQAIHYTSVEHLAPVYLALALTTVAMGLARPYLCSRGSRSRTRAVDEVSRRT
jgi:hypothetical protein